MNENINRKVFDLAGYEIGAGSLSIIAGPCSLENLDMALGVAQEMKEICAARGLLYVFKASFVKTRYVPDVYRSAASPFTIRSQPSPSGSRQSSVICVKFLPRVRVCKSEHPQNI